MKILPVHQVASTQISLCWTRVGLERPGPQSGARRRQHGGEQGGAGFPLCLGQRGRGCWALAAPEPGPEGTLCRGRDPDCCGEGKGTPHPVWGVPTLLCLLHKSQLELLSEA